MKKKTVKSHKSHETKDGFIRIISGQYRGRKLPVKNVTGLRPTTDRVKETVFNWLMHDIRGARVLDCYSGSGGLGFEALSRFAHSITFMELDKTAAQQLKSNIGTLKTDNAEIRIGDTLILLNQESHQCDLVFVDPPFRSDLAGKTCELLESKNWLSAEALIYVEVEAELIHFNPPKNWQLIKEKTAGQVSYRLFKRS